MSSTTTLTPREKQARRYATTLALIATLGPFFYGFEGMVLNAAIKAVGSTFELGPILQGVAGAAGVIGGLIGALAAGRISDKIGRKTTLMWVGPFLLFEALLGPISPLLGGFGYPFLLLTRIVGGIGFGAATTVAPDTSRRSPPLISAGASSASASSRSSWASSSPASSTRRSSRSRAALPSRHSAAS